VGTGKDSQILPIMQTGFYRYRIPPILWPPPPTLIFFAGQISTGQKWGRWVDSHWERRKRERDERTREQKTTNRMV